MRNFYDLRYYTDADILPATEEKKQAWQDIVDYLEINNRVPEFESVVDLGAGNCEFINAVKAPRRYAVDLGVGVRNADKEVHVMQESWSQALNRFENESIDLVFSSNFMEHLQSKEEAYGCVNAVKRVLKKGGAFVNIIPDFKLLGPTYFDEWTHYIPITNRSWLDLLKHHDFKIVRNEPRFLPYTARGMPFNTGLFRIYLRSNILKHVMGKQFLTWAVK